MRRRNHVKRCREERHWSRMKLCGIADVSYLTLSLIENHKAYPSEPTRARVCRALGKSENELWPGDVEKYAQEIKP